jgi:hypothetical protein
MSWFPSASNISLDSTLGDSQQMARQRPVAMARSLKSLSDDMPLDHDEPFIDFSSAGLYLVGLQTTIATVACSAASVASCWLMPVYMISAVRTLAITTLTGFLCMRKAIRVGRVRGVTPIFNSLRPCVPVYVSVLTIEQLVHTCVPTDHSAPGYMRRVVFHGMLGCMAAAGIWRAARPTVETDAPFLITAVATVVIALLPPPAIPLSGPLCEAPSLFGAGERLLRAFLFSAIYVIHVYCGPPKRNAIHDLAICIMRSSAAAVWVLGCHIYLLWLPIVQAVIALWARFGNPQGGPLGSGPVYNSLDTRSDSGLSDAELGALPPPPLERNSDGVLVAPWAKDPLPLAGSGIRGWTSLNGVGGGAAGGSIGAAATSGFGDHHSEVASERAASPASLAGGAAPYSAAYASQGGHGGQNGHALHVPEGVPVDARQLASLVGHGAAPVSNERMAQIAANMK